MQEITQDNFAESIASGVVVVDFYADWCGPCKAIKPILKEISDERPEVPVYLLDIESASEIVQEHGITSIPTVMIFKDGEVVDKMVGVVGKQVILSVVDQSME